ncbi:MAG: hypothetical protein HY770_05485 [Chitinivibrionia bacterium]|nr:hypothetical protein [Chitinivibrionia bacterium]
MLAGLVLPDSHAVRSPRGIIGVSNPHAPGAATRLLSSLSMEVSPLRFYGLERIELSYMDCVVQGADIGLSMGMLIGALGSTAGVWNDTNAWYIAGAMAAMGAILGGSSWTRDPKWRIRYRWEE